VDVPRGTPYAKALLVPLKQVVYHLRKQMEIVTFGFGVHGAGFVVVGQDRPEVVCSGVFVIAAGDVNAVSGDWFGVIVVGFVGDALVEECLVVVPSAGHRHVQHGS